MNLRISKNGASWTTLMEVVLLAWVYYSTLSSREKKKSNLFGIIEIKIRELKDNGSRQVDL